jgi:hypothetical protein
MDVQNASRKNAEAAMKPDTCTHIHPHRRLPLPLSRVALRLGRLYIVISDAVERRLRLEAVKRFGGKKGALSGSVEEALKDWFKEKP